ncbi:MAG: Dam family site-specific DNA-(adenine-N6)-methyltransferase [Christensenellaceae bacterium]|jgi:DNA adenine methylase|nr:Dam family site-specific DNA-(adenine-N6)-methyltransferase [Christensenellaceae bacterium]
MCKNIAKPFIKWAGGKGQLLSKFATLYPVELANGKIKTYIEPFVGGGAVLFDILQKYNVDKAVIIDLNKELINCYRCIKADVNEMIKQLQILENKYNGLPTEKRTDLFLSIRSKYNTIKLNGHLDFEKASDFIFLNKTCFNGLYRVNSKGEFNVPFGKYKNPIMCNKENLLIINKLLQKVEIFYGDYTQCKDYIDGQTFIYFDPPYRPLNTQSFVSYQSNGFDDDNQIKLANFIMECSINGAKIMLSNSDPKNTDPNDNFFDNLYKNFNIKRVNARRMINCQGEKRGNITEIIVRNYKGENND